MNRSPFPCWGLANEAFSRVRQLKEESTRRLIQSLEANSLPTPSPGEFLEMPDSVEKTPHKFRAFSHCSDHSVTWPELVEECLTAWRLKADAFRDISATGFTGSGIATALNELGNLLLPMTPPEDELITRNPYITDLTEILATRMLRAKRPGIRLPHPRVLHKEARGQQHKGIDLIGFEKDDGRYVLLVIEVMSSVDDDHPPTTVSEHYNQIIDTLNESPPLRLLGDLAYVHDECTAESDKSVINGLIAALFNGSRRNLGDTVAIPVLVRPKGLWDTEDWKPFLQKAVLMEGAQIPGVVWFAGIECDCNFSGLLDHVKATALDTKGAN